MLSPKTVVEIYSFEIKGNHMIRLAIINVKHVATMIVDFTKLKILIVLCPLVYNKKGRREGSLDLLVLLCDGYYLGCLYNGLYYPLRVGCEHRYADRGADVVEGDVGRICDEE